MPTSYSPRVAQRHFKSCADCVRRTRRPTWTATDAPSIDRTCSRHRSVQPVTSPLSAPETRSLSTLLPKYTHRESRSGRPQTAAGCKALWVRRYKQNQFPVKGARFIKTVKNTERKTQDKAFT